MIRPVRRRQTDGWHVELLLPWTNRVQRTSLELSRHYVRIDPRRPDGNPRCAGGRAGRVTDIPSTSRTKGHANRSYRLQEPVDETGPGEGTAYVADDPRVFHILVESSNLDWSFTVEEAVFGYSGRHGQGAAVICEPPLRSPSARSAWRTAPS